MTELHNHLLKISGELGKAVYLEKIDIKTAVNLNAMLSEAINFIPCCEQLTVKEWEIDFGGDVLAGLEINNNEPKIIGAMNGWGDGVPLEQVVILELNDC